MVVIPYVFTQPLLERLHAIELLAVEKLRFQDPEELLHHRVV